MFHIPSHSTPSQALYYATLPLRYLIYFTVPDVRRPGSEERINVAVLMTIVWLAILSYVLTVSLTVLGIWWNINGAVMGFTVAAWASNFPAHWSSMVVSKHGFGDVSVCNCLGSNIFNNLIGLGLPWWIYSLWKNQAPYNALQDSGVVISILIMIAMIFIQYVMVACSKWTLSMW
jgi:Ca2+/Na+ antiporter